MRKRLYTTCLFVMCVSLSSCEFIYFVMDDQPDSSLLCGLSVKTSWYSNLLNTTMITLCVENNNSYEVADFQVEVTVVDRDGAIVDRIPFCAESNLPADEISNFKIPTSVDECNVLRVDYRITKANRVY
jgi:hypothetical protein